MTDPTEPYAEDVELMGRAQLFHALARAFQYPVAGLTDDVLDEEFLAALSESVTCHPAAGSLAPLFEAVEEAFSSRNGSARGNRGGAEVAGGRESAGPTISQEYTYLFLRRTKVPLTEASYGLELTFGRPRDMADLASLQETFGVRVAPGTCMSADHLGVQLEFLAVLLAKEAYARAYGWEDEAETCRAARAHYLTEHLTGWLPILSVRVERSARLRFFPAVVALAEGAVRWEHSECGAGEVRQYYDRSKLKGGGDADAPAKAGESADAPSKAGGAGESAGAGEDPGDWPDTGSVFPCGSCISPQLPK